MTAEEPQRHAAVSTEQTAARSSWPVLAGGASAVLTCTSLHLLIALGVVGGLGAVAANSIKIGAGVGVAVIVWLVLLWKRKNQRRRAGADATAGCSCASAAAASESTTPDERSGRP